LLEDEVDGHRLILPARRLANDGITAWAEVLERGYEGMVAKDPASPYRGGRTLSWLKVKQRNLLRRNPAKPSRRPSGHPSSVRVTIGW
jgi:ATP-dependent DNA ligase